MSVLLDTFWVDSRVHASNLTYGPHAASTIVLAAGRPYRVVVDGNWTAWGNDTLLDNGDTTVALIYPSSGQPQTKAALDYEVQWASADAGTYPRHSTSVLISTDDGVTMRHAETLHGPTTVRDETSTYTFLVQGQGFTMRAGVADNQINDNSGRVRFRIYSMPAPPTVGYIGPGLT